MGCIDGTHIFLRKPSENEEMFFNRKGRHSLNVMIVCTYLLCDLNDLYVCIFMPFLDL